MAGLRLRRERDGSVSRERLRRLPRGARRQNLMAAIMEAVTAYATLGEIVRR